MSLPLENKVAFVTGASRGIGQACAITLSKAGAHCIISARTQGGLMQTERLIQAVGGHATLLPLDLASYDTKTLDLIGPSIAAQYNRLDVFVHAAFNFVPLSPVTEITDQAWDKNIHANLSSCRRLIRTLSPILCATPASNAIFLQTILSTAQPFASPLTMVQAGIKALLKSWQQEVAHLSSLLIHHLLPSPTNTLLRQSFFSAESKEKLNKPEQTATELLSFLLS